MCLLVSQVSCCVSPLLAKAAFFVVESGQMGTQLWVGMFEV